MGQQPMMSYFALDAKLVLIKSTTYFAYLEAIARCFSSLGFPNDSKYDAGASYYNIINPSERFNANPHL